MKNVGFLPQKKLQYMREAVAGFSQAAVFLE